MQIEYSKKFQKQFKKCPKKIKKKCIDNLAVFSEDPSHPLLRKHALIGKYRGCYSINLGGDWRIIFDEDKEGIFVLAIGTHSQLYK